LSRRQPSRRSKASATDTRTAPTLRGARSRRSGRGIAYAVDIPEFRLGTQSWTSIPDWLGTFYPPRLSTADALSFYSQVFDTVEVNNTFHALPSESTVRKQLVSQDARGLPMPWTGGQRC